MNTVKRKIMNSYMIIYFLIDLKSILILLYLEKELCISKLSVSCSQKYIFGYKNQLYGSLEIVFYYLYK